MSSGNMCGYFNVKLFNLHIFVIVSFELLSLLLLLLHTHWLVMICAYFQESSDDDADDDEAEMMALLKKKRQQYMTGIVQKPAHTEHVLVSTSSLLPVQNTKLYGGGKVEGILTIVQNFYTYNISTVVQLISCYCNLYFIFLLL